MDSSGRQTGEDEEVQLAHGRRGKRTSTAQPPVPPVAASEGPVLSPEGTMHNELTCAAQISLPETEDSVQDKRTTDYQFAIVHFLTVPE